MASFTAQSFTSRWLMTTLVCGTLAVHAGAAGTPDERPLTVRMAIYDVGTDHHPVALLLRDAYAVIGVRLQSIDIPLARALTEVDRGVIVDADPGRVREAIAGFENLVLVPEPVHILEIAAFVRGDAAPVTGWESLKGRRIITFNGSIALDQALIANGITDVMRTNAPPNAALMLLIGRADVALLPRPETIALLSKYNSRLLRQSGPLLLEAPLYHVLNKRHAALATPLALAIRNLRRARRQ